MYLVSTLRKRFRWYVPSMNPCFSRDKYSRNFSSRAFCERKNKARNKMFVILIRFSVWLQVIFIVILFFSFFPYQHIVVRFSSFNFMPHILLLFVLVV